ncbi:MAG: hypothetical protein ILO68_02140, partial [Clostridia bacterium]|nr:hypothetical protein [Clostridia bacterium]
CPLCRAPLTGQETRCPGCGAALTPVAPPPAPPKEAEPKKEKKKMTPKQRRTLRIVLGVILAVLLAAAVFLLWYFRAWFFAPSLQTDAFVPTDVLHLNEPVRPDEAQTQALQAYIQELSVQSYNRMDFTERKGAEKLETMTKYLSMTDPDIEKMLQEMGLEVKNAGQESAVKGGDGTLSIGTILLKSDGSVKLSSDDPETGEAPDAAGTESAEDADLSITLAPEAFHSSGRIRLTTSDKKAISCPACGHRNPLTAEVCEKCGTRLSLSDYEADAGTIEYHGDAGSALSEEQLESMMLSNLSSSLLLANRKAMAFYLTCLACMRDPDNVSAIVSLVTHLRMRGGLEEALIICQHGLEMDPTREELFVHAGNILVQLDRPDDALSYLNRCVSLNGFSGPAYQASMFAYLQKKDYVNAIRCMIEGARDGYVSSIRIVYDMLKLSPDYWTYAGKVFENYTIPELMDFTVNRSGFNPAAELAGKSVDISPCKVPYSPEDWAASADTIFNQGRAYLSGAVNFYKDEIQEIAQIYEILLNADDVMDLAQGFLSAFGDKLKKEKLTEAQRVISYEQETFWLDILDDYREWKIKDIRAKLDEKLDGSGLEEFIKLMDTYLEETRDTLESIDMESMEGLAFALNFLLERVEGNHSIGFTSAQSEKLVSKVKSGLQINGRERNQAYSDIAEVLQDYYMYSNAMLGMIADKELYEEYRREITFNVTTEQGLCVVENSFYAITVPILIQPYLMIGDAAQSGITKGALTGSCPVFPKFVISNRAAQPSADMNADIDIPDIRQITGDVLGVDLYHPAGTSTGNEFPALGKIWEMKWRADNPDFIGPAPNPPDFRDSYERTKFWNSLTPEERVRFSRMVADPEVVNRAIVLDLYCARGQSAVHFSEEKIGLANGLGISGKLDGLGLEFGSDGTVSGSAEIGMGTLSVSSNGNFSVTMEDKISGFNFGASKTGRDVTAFVGTDFKFSPKAVFSKDENGNATSSAQFEGLGAGAGGQIYTTYSLAQGKVTSGGVKTGAGFVIGGLLGLGTTTNVNLVQGISTTEVYLIIAGNKLSLRFKEDYNYEDDRTDDDVPGLQEF